MKEYIILYPVSYHKYHKHSSNKQLHYTKIEFTSEDQKEFGTSIPSECTSINDNCFNNSDITEITLPRNIKHISLNSFLHCTQLKNVYVMTSNIFYPRVSYLMSKLITQTNGIMCNDIIFTLEDRIHSTLNDEKISNIAFVPKGIKEIGQSCFESCPQYEKISLPQTVRFIHVNAFTEITLPPFLSKLGKNAFLGCTSLTSLVLGEYITSIDFCTFKDCSSLQKVHLPNHLISIEHRAFCGCRNLKELYLPPCLTSIGFCAFNECESMSVINLDHVSQIEGGAFSDCHRLKLIQIPLLTSIPEYCFSQCKELTQISFGNYLTSIQNNAFYKCIQLKTLLFPSSLEKTILNQ
ncbi:leucine rich repeat protein, BspA family protein [Entamoeba nuttalli P19]|uniref:Leucine rich repeat protein, BspA family protein n=1 Tax=Entamoeba nuttalli (strain P19) TaxID=1076696 RepID=K2GFC3_ENTNP|nr:leucine rich repeat protein, BspA family protein [Entamoeba nuttalli P19]EKE41366.1 leucine rich repeat protein, BspA family protein [Entamoeba nuttalli P19]|eukprot:XP_008856302.1 leucine rich repeat protein, BspA family protein [Entamoeba nuttalli P19]